MLELQPSDPSHIGEYRLIGRLGSGGFGIVYQAEDSAGNDVALKLLRSEIAEDPEARSRLLREADALQRVQGPRTCAVLDVVVEEQHAYLVMELVAGVNLFAFVDEQGPLTGPMLWTAAAGLCEALESIHAAGVIHRDLKPENVMYGAGGVKVLDFGISLIRDTPSLTRTGYRPATRGWISPEIARPELAGDKGVDTRSDVFNLGMVVYFAATGQHPFDPSGDSAEDAVFFRIPLEPPDLSGVEVSLRFAIEQCLQKNPADRPSLESLRKFFASNGSTNLDGRIVSDTQHPSRGTVSRSPSSGETLPPPGHTGAAARSKIRRLLPGLGIGAAVLLAAAAFTVGLLNSADPTSNSEGPVVTAIEPSGPETPDDTPPPTSAPDTNDATPDDFVDLNCSDFEDGLKNGQYGSLMEAWQAAQELLESTIEEDPRDPHNLDGNDNGIACEDLKKKAERELEAASPVSATTTTQAPATNTPTGSEPCRPEDNCVPGGCLPVEGPQPNISPSPIPEGLNAGDLLVQEVTIDTGCEITWLYQHMQVFFDRGHTPLYLEPIVMVRELLSKTTDSQTWRMKIQLPPDKPLNPYDSYTTSYACQIDYIDKGFVGPPRDFTRVCDGRDAYSRYMIPRPPIPENVAPPSFNDFRVLTPISAGADFTVSVDIQVASFITGASALLVDASGDKCSGARTGGSDARLGMVEGYMFDGRWEARLLACNNDAPWPWTVSFTAGAAHSQNLNSSMDGPSGPYSEASFIINGP